MPKVGKMTGEKKVERLHSLDFWKGICIIFVLITHFTWTDSERLKYFFPFWIDMSVPMFMIISGYVYTKSYEKHKIKNFDEAYNYKNILGKIVRYTIPFLIAFVIEEVALFFLVHNKQNIFQMGLSFLRGGLGPGSYYYPVMIQFIFLFPMIFFIVKKYRKNGLLCCGVINIFFELLKRVYYMNEECYRLLIFRYILLIGFGVYLALGYSKKNEKLGLISFLVGLTYIIVFKYLGVNPIITTFWTGTSVFAVLYFIPISKYLLLNEKFKFNVVELFGKASYNIFLVQMVYYYCSLFISNFVDTRWMQLGINILICLSVGVVFYKVEDPITKIINKKVLEFADNILEKMKKISFSKTCK